MTFQKLQEIHKNSEEYICFLDWKEDRRRITDMNISVAENHAVVCLYDFNAKGDQYPAHLIREEDLLRRVIVYRQFYKGK